MLGEKKIYGITFNCDVIKKHYSVNQFKKVYEGKLGESAEAVYYQITGKSKPKKKGKD